LEKYQLTEEKTLMEMKTDTFKPNFKKYDKRVSQLSKVIAKNILAMVGKKVKQIHKDENEAKPPD
jgi:septation ring formation regulator EzrA